MEDRRCSIVGCGRPFYGRRRCRMHYDRDRRKGLLPPKPKMKTTCAYDGCERTVLARGLCSMHYEREPDRVAYQSEWYYRNKPEMQIRMRKRYEAHQEELRLRRLAQYGLTQEAFDVLFASQGNCCAICKATTPGKGKGRWHIDHDHACCPTPAQSCGRCVRGILCAGCNPGLGSFHDDVTILLAAVAYLERFQAKEDVA